MIRLCAFADEASEFLDEQIKALKRNNIHLIEIRGVDGKNILKLSDDEALKTYQKLKENGIGVWSIGSPIGKVDITTDFTLYRKEIIRACELANILHAPNIRVFSFFKAYKNRDLVIKYMNEMVNIAKQYNVKMCHENEKEIYGDNADRCVDVLDNTHGLYCVYDPANFIQVKQDPVDSLKKLYHRTYYFHIKDCLKETGEVVPAGKGDGHILEIVKNIKDDKVLTIEPHLTVFKGYSLLDKTTLKTKYSYESANEAFDVAVSSIKDILNKANYHETKEGFSK